MQSRLLASAVLFVSLNYIFTSTSVTSTTTTQCRGRGVVHLRCPPRARGTLHQRHCHPAAMRHGTGNHGHVVCATCRRQAGVQTAQRAPGRRVILCLRPHELVSAPSKSHTTTRKQQHTARRRRKNTVEADLPHYGGCWRLARAAPSRAHVWLRLSPR